MPDYFEADRMIEDLAKIYSTACATTWFKVSGSGKPTPERYREKVVEFMKNIEYSLSAFPDTPAASSFREHVTKRLQEEISRVKAGENKEVEKRYKYFVDYS